MACILLITITIVPKTLLETKIYHFIPIVFWIQSPLSHDCCLDWYCCMVHAFILRAWICGMYSCKHSFTIRCRCSNGTLSNLSLTTMTSNFALLSHELPAVLSITSTYAVGWNDAAVDSSLVGKVNSIENKVSNQHKTNDEFNSSLFLWWTRWQISRVSPRLFDR